MRTHIQRVINSLAQTFQCFPPYERSSCAPTPLPPLPSILKEPNQQSPGSLGLFEEAAAVTEPTL